LKYIFLALALALSENASIAGDAKPRLTLGSVVDEIDRSRGGCLLQLPHEYAKREGNYTFVSDFEGHALVNVDLVDVHLTLVKSKGPDVRERGQLGEHSSYSYSGEGLDVGVDYLVTEACPSANKPCKVTRYDAVLTVKRGRARKTVAAKAVCGS
jgi:hypothetical protein